MSLAKPRKDKPFAIRLTVDERRELERRAGEMALGGYIKAVLFADGDKRRRRGPRSPVKDHAKLAEVLACLGQSRLGETLQQLSQAVESGTLHVDDSVPIAVQRACEDIILVRLLLMQALGFQLPSQELQGTEESASQSFARAARHEDDQGTL